MSISGKIAQILDPTQVVLNVGSQQGVVPGMEFVIFEEGQEVVDPSSGESLGRLELVKGRVVAVHVQDRMTLAATPPREKPAEAPSVLSARLAEVSREDARERREELYVQRSQLAGAPARKPVQVGDNVRSVDKATPS